MESKLSPADKRHTTANDNRPETVVQRLVERGVIQPGEGADMLALLLAISELSLSNTMTIDRDLLQQSEPAGQRLPRRGRKVRES